MPRPREREREAAEEEERPENTGRVRPHVRHGPFYNRKKGPLGRYVPHGPLCGLGRRAEAGRHVPHVPLYCLSIANLSPTQILDPHSGLLIELLRVFLDQCSKFHIDPCLLAFVKNINGDFFLEKSYFLGFFFR